MSRGLLYLALLPGFLIIIYIFRKDKVEREPIGLLVKLTLFGAASCVAAMFAETLVEICKPGYGGLKSVLFEAFVEAALIEEVLKFTFLRLGSWRNKHFDYRFDGIVYGVCVAVGFALLENVMYVASGGFKVAVMRALLAVPLHAICGAYMGIFYGATKKYSITGNTVKKCISLLFAMIIPISLHGIYDTLAFLNNFESGMGLFVFMVIMYIVSIKVINKFSRDDWKNAFYQLSGDN